MAVQVPLITIGYDKNGMVEFGISGTIAGLSLESMQEIRALIPVAIWQAEDMWRTAFFKRPENRGYCSRPATEGERNV